MKTVELLEKLDEKWQIEKEIEEGIQELKSSAGYMTDHAYGRGRIDAKRFEVLRFLESKIKDMHISKYDLISYYTVMKELYSLWCEES